ncbi:histidine kinase [Streptosporangium soli]|nr:histidine kinase [Streptosporangium sp. KLBMP 9127]
MARRFLLWWSGHHQVADALLAVVACAFLLIEVPYSDRTILTPGDIPLMFWGDLTAYAALAWRRRSPLVVLTLVWALWLAGGRWDIWTEWNASWAELGTPTALMLMFYTAGRWSPSRRVGLLLAGTLLPCALSIVQLTRPGLLPSWVPAPADALFLMSPVLCAGAWALGRVRRSDVEAVALAEESRAQAVLAEERVRIARELHDIVAHNVSAMVIQSDGAAAALLDDDVAEVGKAVDAIGRSGRVALGELRLLLAVLRDVPDGPQPGVEAIESLAERLPLEVRLRVEGQVREMPAALGLAAYRIVQEALTNTLRHAGKEANAEVLLHYAEDGLHIQITDDGAFKSQGTPGVSRLKGSGHGLVGIRERAAMFGGTAQAASLPRHGFEVRATLPWT